LQIASAWLRGLPLLQVIGDIDHQFAPVLLSAAEDALGPNGQGLLLDLSGCPYLDSGGISVLLMLLKVMKSRLGWLGVISPSPDVHRLLEIVALTPDPDFRVFPSMARLERHLEDQSLGS
jgi:anti-sigma B factor antagonist